MITTLIVLVSTGVVMGLIRWAYTQGREAGDAQAQNRISRKLYEHSEATMEWYMDAHDLERIKFTKAEIEGYTRALRIAQRLVRERFVQR